MKKITPRVRYIIESVGMGVVQVGHEGKKAPWHINRPRHYQATTTRSPSRAETDKLFAAGWVDLEIDPLSTTSVFHKDGTTTTHPHYRARLTDAGRAAIEWEWCPFCQKSHPGGGTCMGHHP